MNAWDAVQVSDATDPHHGIAGRVVSVQNIDPTGVNNTAIVRLDTDGSDVQFKQSQLHRLG